MNDKNDYKENVPSLSDEPVSPFDKPTDPIEFSSRSNQSHNNIETRRSLIGGPEIVQKRKYDSDLVVNRDA
jgi:hypothetical protein